MSKGPIIIQFVNETESWGRLLSFFSQENVYLKTRLAEIVNSSLPNEDIELAEKFQEDFLTQDKIISFLSGDLKEQKSLLQRDLYEDGQLFKKLMREQKKLRKHIKREAEWFAKIKNRFTDYLSTRFLNNFP
jgi:hypothetical protein